MSKFKMLSTVSVCTQKMVVTIMREKKQLTTEISMQIMMGCEAETHLLMTDAGNKCHISHI